MGLYIGNQRVCPIVRVKGDDTQGEFLVTVIDYDGTILKQDHLNTGDKMYLPPEPNHSNLVFQGWSCVQGVTTDSTGAQYVTVNGSDITVGAFYNTVDGNTEIDIEITKLMDLDITVKIQGEKDWGDGTTDSLQTHTYADYGNYTIVCKGSSWGSISSSSGAFNQGTSSANYFVKAIIIGSKLSSINITYALQYLYGLETISISRKSVTSVGSYFLRNCINLRAVVIPEGIRTIGNYALYYIQQLQYVALPSTVNTLNQYSLSALNQLQSITLPPNITTMANSLLANCSHLQRITIPNRVTSIGSSSISGCYSLSYIKIPPSVTSIGSSAFANDRECIYDFSSHTAIPTLTAGAFNGLYITTKILVPNALLASWKAATNWAAYADYIYGV